MNKSGIAAICFFCIALFLLACEKDKCITPEEKPERILVLITDFAPDSDVVIRFTGRVLSEFSDISVEYIQARPHSIKESAYIVQSAVESYPSGTFFTAIVEPDAADARMIFEIPTDKTILIPDNGLASRLFHSTAPNDIFKVENASVLNGLDPVDLTFAEIYTEATCSMLAGTPLAEFGGVLSDPVKWDIQDAARMGDIIQGEILFSDNFGNCITNITDSLLTGFSQQSLLQVCADSDSFYVTLGSNYASVPVGENVAFVNSTRRLELAVNNDALTQRYQIGAGTPILIEPTTVRIGILQYNNSSISDAIVVGMKLRLDELGLDEQSNTIFIERSAMGDATVLPGLIDEMVTTGIDVLVPVSTPASQAAVQHAPSSVPIIFTYVTDPASAGILDQRDDVTGLSDAINYSQYLQFVKRLLPSLTIAGRIYSEHESNAVFAQSQLVALGPIFGIEWKSATVTGIGGVPAAYQQIRDQGIGAIVIVDDNTMSLAMPTLVSLALSDTLIVVGQARDHVRDGALASVSVSNEKLAVKTAEVVMSIIRGMDPDFISIQRFDTDVIAVNTQTAEMLNYTFPADILEDAQYIYP
ncbi:SAM-dependent chlorinase/fluorinase [candidate division KSB1 bacterium]|nr:SAM-dependent chlorinase/fluorinase [candidate division KSB1 bacterium]